MIGRDFTPFDADALLAVVVQATNVGMRRGQIRYPASVPKNLPPESVNPVMGGELPVFDVEMFDRTAAFLASEMVVSYLDNIVTLGESLLPGLRGLNALTSNESGLVDLAHKLAGSAGMFGFKRVASVACRFERAVETGSADVSLLAGGLGVAIEATRKAALMCKSHQVIQEVGIDLH